MQSAQMIKNLWFLFVISLGVFASPSDRASEIDRFMSTLHERGQFNGSIVVAKDGKLIYRGAFGEADWQSHRKFTPTTISNLASVSNQFTAMPVTIPTRRTTHPSTVHAARKRTDWSATR